MERTRLAPPGCRRDHCAMAVVAGHELLEREEVLEALAGALAEALAGVAGSCSSPARPAVGKTARGACLLRAPRRRRRVLWGACDPLFTPRPLGPFLDVAEQAAGAGGAVVGGRHRPHDVSRVAAVLADPPVAWSSIEDLHWADEATLDVVRVLARTVVRAPVLVIATYRDDELEAAHPLRIVLGELADAQRGRAPRRRVAVAGRGRAAGRAGRHRRRRAAPRDLRQPVLRDGGDRVGRRRRPAHRPGGGPWARARLRAAARELLDAVAISPQRTEIWLLEALVGDRASALEECIGSGMLTARPGGSSSGTSSRASRSRRPSSHGRRRILHRRALAALGAPAGRRARRRPARAPRRGRARRRRGAPLRARRGRPRGGGRRAPRGRRPARPGPALRRRPRPPRPRRAPAPLRRRVLPDRPLLRRHRRRRGAARVLRGRGRPLQGGRDALAGRPAADVPRQRQGGRARGQARDRAARGVPAGRGARDGLREPRGDLHERRGPRRHPPLRGRGDRARRAARRDVRARPRPELARHDGVPRRGPRRARGGRAQPRARPRRGPRGAGPARVLEHDLGGLAAPRAGARRDLPAGRPRTLPRAGLRPLAPADVGIPSLHPARTGPYRRGARVGARPP